MQVERVVYSASAFSEEFRAFAEEEARCPVPSNSVVFYGSSSIRLWATLREDFPELPVVNRGFGGSTLEECVAEMDRLVTPLRPRGIVLYAGDNDLDHGATPEHILALFQRFAVNVRSRLGSIPLLLLAIKPSPARMANAARIRKANELLREAVSAWPNVTFVDVFTAMIDDAGRSHRALFAEDWLHLSAAGYRLWTTMVRRALIKTGLLSAAM